MRTKDNLNVGVRAEGIDEVSHIVPVSSLYAGIVYRISQWGFSNAMQTNYSLCEPSRYSTNLPGLLPLDRPDIFASLNNLSNSCICAWGTISSLRPLSINTGVVAGMRCTFEAESHFWWQRKATRDNIGIAVGISRGMERNVFSRIRAWIWQINEGQSVNRRSTELYARKSENDWFKKMKSTRNVLL